VQIRLHKLCYLYTGLAVTEIETIIQFYYKAKALPYIIIENN